MQSFPDGGVDICIFDMARLNDPCYWPWAFMENLKSGWFCATKYYGMMKKFPIPKIIVFTNVEPDLTKFTRDRYDIMRISEEGEEMPLANE